MTNLFGLENLLARIPTDPKSPLNLNSNNANTGTGQIQRNETVTLSLAGVVTQVLPNGNLVVVASQQFRVNSELRVLTASGVIRRDDIASDNSICSTGWRRRAYPMAAAGSLRMCRRRAGGSS